MSGSHPAVRVAIVGSGPAGSYAAGHLLRHSDPEVHVDMYERLPTPWGLVRSGVAPDHPKIKSVTRLFEKTAAHPRFHYYGNVEFGRHVRLEQLRERYNAIIYAVGTPGDRPLGVPGEELPGSWAATDFVGWYNGHPDYADLEFDLSGERGCCCSPTPSSPRPTPPTTRWRRSTRARSARSSSSRGAGPSRRRSRTPSCWSSAS
jgi:ferredoxin--NADP+ reductase